jgi:hypothetical protein
MIPGAKSVYYVMCLLYILIIIICCVYTNGHGDMIPIINDWKSCIWGFILGIWILIPRIKQYSSQTMTLIELSSSTTSTPPRHPHPHPATPPPHTPPPYSTLIIPTHIIDQIWHSIYNNMCIIFLENCSGCFSCHAIRCRWISFQHHPCGWLWAVCTCSYYCHGCACVLVKLSGPPYAYNYCTPL